MKQPRYLSILGLRTDTSSWHINNQPTNHLTSNSCFPPLTAPGFPPKSTVLRFWVGGMLPPPAARPRGWQHGSNLRAKGGKNDDNKQPTRDNRQQQQKKKKTRKEKKTRNEPRKEKNACEARNTCAKQLCVLIY